MPRITPAYAGKSGYYSTAGSSGKDHPRVCGEKISVKFCCTSASGSPPRMRGKVAVSLVLILAAGITPAYAGNRLWWCRHSAGLRDHPRVCGEKENPLDVLHYYPGSPPRMRGKGYLQVRYS